MEFSINKKPKVIRKVLKDDGIFPNNTLTLLIYKNVLHFSDEEPKHAAKIFEDLFEKNKWSNSWRNGIYKYHHYHSITHEVLGVYEGNTIVQLGGEAGI